MNVRRTILVLASVVATASSSMLACFSSDSTPPNPDGGGGDATATPDAAPPSDAGPDVSAEAAAPETGAPPDTGADVAPCTVQPYLQALGADAGGTSVAHDFTCPDGLDVDASTGSLDFAGSGWLRAPQTFQFETTGDGGAGAYAGDAGPVPDGGWPQGAPSIAPGVNQLTSFDLESGQPTVNGDLTLAVSGPFTITGNADLYVQGNLTIVATGPIVICGGLYAGGNVTIQQPTAAGVTVGCQVPYDDAGGVTIYDGIVYAGGSGGGLAAVSAGDIDIATRGTVQMMVGYMYAGAFGSGAQARGGSITFRSYGDITLGSTIQEAYLYAGAPCSAPGDAGACAAGTNGDIRFSSEGTITLQDSSYVYGGDLNDGAQGGNVSMRALNGIVVKDSSYLYAGAAGNVELRTQGPVTFGSGTYAYSGGGEVPGGVGTTPTKVDVVAASVSMTSAYLYAGGMGGAVTVAATGDVTLDQTSYLVGGDATCGAAGGVTLSSEGNVSITNGSYIEGGNSVAGSGCAAAVGGSAIVRASGTITAPVPDAGNPPLVVGTGTPAGAATQTPGASVDVGVLDAQLQPSVAAVSLPQVTTSSSLLFGQLGTTDPPTFLGAHLLVAPGAAAQFVPVGHVVGQALSSGWRYEVLLQPRMFDPTAVDGLALRLQ